MKTILNLSLICTLIIGCDSISNQTVDIKNKVPIKIDSKLELVDTVSSSTTPLLEEPTILTPFPEFDDYTLITDEYIPQTQIEGDFFGDNTDDIAVLVRKNNLIHIGIIDYGTDTLIKFIGDTEDNLKRDDYSWIGIFKSVPSGDTLWSNYVDDFRDLEEVPFDERVVLNYDAIYAHASESCGGGFIFWKDNKWNWLQQE